MFLIRDHVPKETPLEKLKSIILKDMVGIWDSLIKPQEHANSKAEDFFDFSFTALPHKVLAEGDFYNEVAVLRERWYFCFRFCFIVKICQSEKSTVCIESFL